MTYEEALQKINSRLLFGIKPGLERIEALSVTALSVLLPAHAASDTVSAAAINIAVIFFFIVVHSSYRIL